MIDIGVPDGAGSREVEIGPAGARVLPDRVGVLPLRDTVTFPDMLVPLNIGQPRSVELINEALRGERTIAMVASRHAEVETPSPDPGRCRSRGRAKAPRDRDRDRGAPRPGRHRRRHA